MEEISSFTDFPSTTNSGAMKSLGDSVVSATIARMAGEVLNILGLFIIELFEFTN